ncbi:right-handed parallel beta-helix repeat-containing protein [uncultured Maricaulis sp.]|uniref:right-handed parallel beta-helix repeat-containing protein n=1 Tax=uncultured Maricaulis sp. TaxID=174710 RepID=UPI0030D7718B|tara:strand:- start:95918 stop:97324 length:1407 start_codon:yes stop_codon:yes gene_type:complete
MSVSRRKFLFKVPVALAAAPVTVAAASVVIPTVLAGAVTGSASAGTLSAPTLLNVRDYGALGDGFTNDTTAINNAIAALTDHSALYFPPGKYLTSGLSTLSNRKYVTVFGDSAVLNQISQANNTWVVDRTCENITVRGLTFGGAATSRLNGVHLRFRASKSVIENCEFYGCSDFGLQIGDHTNAIPTQDVQVISCYAHNTQGDGFHVNNADGVIFEACTARDTGDDSFAAVGYEAYANTVKNVRFLNCVAYNAGWRGFLLQYANDCAIIGCRVNGAQGAGLEVSANASYSTIFNEDITIKNSEFFDTCAVSGPPAGVGLFFSKRLTIENCHVEDTVGTNNYAIFDVDDLTVKKCSERFTRPGYGRGIHMVDISSVNGRSPRTNWGKIQIDGFDFDHQQSSNNEAIYFVPQASITVSAILVEGVRGFSAVTGNYLSIHSPRFTTGKIGNCTSMEGRPVYTGAFIPFNMN